MPAVPFPHRTAMSLDNTALRSEHTDGTYTYIPVTMYTSVPYIPLPAVVCHATPTKDSPQRKRSSENSRLQLQHISERKHAACAAPDHAWTSLGQNDRLARNAHPPDLTRHTRRTVSDSKPLAPHDPLYVDHLFVETFSPASP